MDERVYVNRRLLRIKRWTLLTQGDHGFSFSFFIDPWEFRCIVINYSDKELRIEWGPTIWESHG